MPLPTDDTLLPLATVPAAQWRTLDGVLTDVDDTLTADGAVEPAARQALRALADAGVPVIAVTGRPVGWSEPLARAEPLAAVVAENGGAMWRRVGGALRLEFAQDDATRDANVKRLRACAEAVLREVPGSVLARDSAGRRTDIAVDHGEFAHLDAAQVDAVVAVMRRHGLHATVSSIHVNGWIGEHTKLSGARWAVEAALGRPFDAARWVYVGDSTNDQLMFEHVPLSVGVANLARFLPQLRVRPRCLARGERGQGFAEVAMALLAARAGVQRDSSSRSGAT
ncbi:MAG: HAD-IIB family hydrolase [Gammaproteobacteria bacterium]|uniref:HAD-IIB family hydrolase n=1 Tax=Azohydromonas sp. TaxID=1872666 RepID=UPI002B7F1277|nr:HAD-IIB family hydrolase [Azohydromonas sp.]HMM85461.1 HAD-IIB family hydrolase [Azohydromonas sp.]